MKRPTPGKVPIEFLKRFVFGRLGAPREDAIQGPGVGRDFAATKYNDMWVISSSDPVTGSQTFLGRIAVNVSTNDVSMSGIAPSWLSLTALMPVDFKPREAKKLFGDAHQQARQLGVAIVGGHTEYVSYISRPIVVATAIGASRRKPKLPSDVRPGDVILLVGEIGVEGTAILATEKRTELTRKGIPASVLSRARGLILKTSVMRLALEIAEFDSVMSMHDPTEGGLIGGLYETSVASDLGFEADLSDVPVRRETKVIAGALRLDPCKLISSGSILASCSPQGFSDVLTKLRKKNVRIKSIGKFTERGGERVILREGRSSIITDAPSDELWRVID